MAELKPFEVIMRVITTAGQNAKGEIVVQAEKVTELVRCHDCKHMDAVYPYCNAWENVTEEDGYCYMGKNADDTYCNDETCETFLRDLNCERCTK